MAAGNDRFRGIRQTAAWDPDPLLVKGMFSGTAANVYRLEPSSTE